MATLQKRAPVEALNAAVVVQWYTYIAPAASMSGMLALLQLPSMADVYKRAPEAARRAKMKPLLETPITEGPAVPLLSSARVPNMGSEVPPTRYAHTTAPSAGLTARTKPSLAGKMTRLPSGKTVGTLQLPEALSAGAPPPAAVLFHSCVPFTATRNKRKMPVEVM
jgi:hypothetical protein